MKLLVLAQTPPPLHGQSFMVGQLVAGLPSRGIPLQHVNLRLSRDAADIGSFQLRKIAITIACGLRSLGYRFRGYDTLYYIPSPPGKRGALYRDWFLLALCRPFFRRVIFHWHAAGLAAWLETRATGLERLISRLVLGRVDLALVLSAALRDDADRLAARRVVILPNGIPDPGEPPPAPAPTDPCRLFFLALCSEEKGLFAAANAVIRANASVGSDANNPAFTLTAAGPFDQETTAARFRILVEQHPTAIRYAGVVDEIEKRRLFTQSHALVFPTHYAAEAQPLVVMEALAHGRPVIATAWRGIPELVTPEVGTLVPVGHEAALVDALLRLRQQPPQPASCRARFLAYYTLERHLIALASAIKQLPAG